MSNSSMVSYTKLSPNHSGQRTHAIDCITPHCVVGQLSAEGICGLFTSADRQASCNYAVGTDGKIGLCVDEGNRSWCSSSRENDQRAVTIECASDLEDPYAMNDAVYNALVALCVDICQRNGKTKLLWLADKDKTLAYEPAEQEMVLTVHRWFANKSCPGPWLYERLGALAEAVTAKLGATTSNDASGSYAAGTKVTLSNVAMYTSSTSKEKSSTKTGTYYLWSSEVVNGRIRITNSTANVGKSGQVTGWVNVSDLGLSATTSTTSTDTEQMYRIRKTWADAASQIGAYKVLENAKAACKEGYTVYDKDGNAVYSVAAKTATPYMVKITERWVLIRKGPGANYDAVGEIKDQGVYTIVEESGDWGLLKSYQSGRNGWIYLDYTKQV